MFNSLIASWSCIWQLPPYFTYFGWLHNCQKSIHGDVKCIF